MTNAASPISRRTIAKGAAWTIPAISVAAAAPSLAASPVLQCPTVPGWVEDPNSGPRLGRSFGDVNFNFGILTPKLYAPADANLYRWTPMAISGRDQGGSSVTGQIISHTTTPNTVGSGGTLNARVAFAGFEDSWSEEHRLESFTVTSRIEWIQDVGTGQNVLLECDGYVSTVEVTEWREYHNVGDLTSFAV